MGYVETPFSKVDTPVVVQVRGKNQPASVAKMPFVPNGYYRKE
jgi:aminomethyltransferase